MAIIIQRGACPFLTSYAVERLENAKYLGVPGLGSLQQFLVNASAYNLKYVFSNDAFYDPLLHFTGWTRLNRLTSGVTIWEKGDVLPLPAILPQRQINPHAYPDVGHTAALWLSF